MAIETRQGNNYRALVENVDAIILEMDLAGNITFINAPAMKFYGYSEDEIVGKNMVGTLVARESEYASRVISLLRELEEGKRDRVTAELLNQKKNGEPVWVLWTGCPLHDVNGPLRRIVGIGQDITFIKDTEWSLRRSNRQLEILSQTIQKLNSVLDTTVVLRTLVAAAMELAHATGGTAGLFRNGKMLFTEYNNNGNRTPIQYAFGPATGVPGWIIVHRRSYATNDAQHDPYLLPGIRQTFGIYSLVNIPILDRRGELIGCFELHNKREYAAFDAHDIMMLEGLAASASVALENAELLAEREKAELTYRTIFETTGTAIALLEKDGTIALVNAEFEKLSGFSRGEIEGKMHWRDFVARRDLLRVENFSARLRAGEDVQRERPELILLDRSGAEKCCIVLAARVPASDRSIVSVLDITMRKSSEESLRQSEERLRLITMNSPDQVFQQDQALRYVWMPKVNLPYLSADVIGHNDFELFPPDDAQKLVTSKRKVMDRGEGMRTEVSLSFKDRRRFFDAVYEPWRNGDGQIVGILGYIRDITSAKEDQEKLKVSFEKEKKTTNAIIDTMLKVVEIRDPYTAGHEEHTAELAATIGKEMGLPEDMIEGIRMGAFVHDIGKIFIPVEILSKPGILSEAEFNIIKIHPSAGYDILKLIDFPWPVAEIVYQHHERYNGSGYPRKLKNDEILLQARVLMVADVIDSIALHRPYRASIGLEKALNEITVNRGVLFDPRVVDAAIKVFKEHKFNY